MPKVAVRPKTGPINRPMAVAGALAFSAMAMWPAQGSSYEWYAGPAVFSSLAAALFVRATRTAYRDYELRKAFAVTQATSTSHGSAREASASERGALGLDQPMGDLLGLDRKGRPVWAPAKVPFMLVEMPPGAGKTVCFVLPQIIHHILIGQSVVVFDPKLELAPMLVPTLRAQGYEARVFNPARKHMKLIGSDEIGLYQPLIAAIHGNRAQRRAAARLVRDYAHIHHPISNAERNPYFAHGSIRVLSVAIGSQALLFPENATPTSVYALITDPSAFQERLQAVAAMDDLDEDEPIIDFLRLEARNLLGRASENAENYASFLEGASQRLLSFNPAGNMANYGAGSPIDLAELRRRQIVLFLATPLSNMSELSDALSLMSHNIVAVCKDTPDGHPVHLVAEEALSYRFHEFTTSLETLRGLGVSGAFFIQSFAGLEKTYGREAAQAIESYADVRIYGGINSPARARFISEMLSDATLRQADASYQTEMKSLSLSSKEFARPLMKVNEVLAMPRNTVWAFVRGLRPLYLTTVTYAEAAPWRDWVGPNPLTGEKLAGKVKVTIDYGAFNGAR